MAEKSIYEKDHPSRRAQNNAICFGRIHKVDPERRMCTVKTFFATDPAINDLYIQKCQWLNMDCNPAGDEATSVPRTGSIGMVVFVQGEPFIFGYFRGLDKNGKALTGKEKAKLTEGDKIISTQAGNYVLVKANGSIEIKSKETLKTLYFPTNSLLQHLVRNYELKADGGIIDWKSAKDGSTKYSATFRKDLLNSFMVLEERGSVDGNIMYRTLVGPGIGGGSVAVYRHEVDLTGETRLAIGPPGVEAFKAKIDATGLCEVDTIGDITVRSSLGHIQIHAQAQDVAVLADVGDVDVEATVGDVKINGSLAKLKLGKGQVGLGTDTVELLDLFAQTLSEIGNFLLASGQETHTFLGYPTTPPNNLPDYVKIQTKITEIQAKLASIMGGV